MLFLVFGLWDKEQAVALTGSFTQIFIWRAYASIRGHASNLGPSVRLAVQTGTWKHSLAAHTQNATAKAS